MIRFRLTLFLQNKISKPVNPNFYTLFIWLKIKYKKININKKRKKTKSKIRVIRMYRLTVQLKLNLFLLTIHICVEERGPQLSSSSILIGMIFLKLSVIWCRLGIWLNITFSRALTNDRRSLLLMCFMVCKSPVCGGPVVGIFALLDSVQFHFELWSCLLPWQHVLPFLANPS